MKKIIFKNSDGKKLVGNLFDFGKNYIVVHCHGYGANKDSESAVALQEALAENKISSFAFDFSDSGESEPKKDDLTITAGIDDLNCAINFLKNLGLKNFALSSASFGGSVVLNYTLDDKDIKAIALRAPVSDWLSMFEFWTSKKRSKKFYQDTKKYTIYNKASQIKCPVLIIHGAKDIDVPQEQSEKTCRLMKNCELKIIDGIDHDLADHDDRIDLGNYLNFFIKYKCG